MIEDAIKKIEANSNLDQQEAFDTLESIFEGNIPEEYIINLLDALQNKGESISEITGFSNSLRSRCISISGASDAVDTCGTGGSNLDRFNIGTTVAFILASGGYPVAKHGNRGSKRPNGSFDLLEKLDVFFETTPEQEEKLFDKLGLVFLFARTHHPGMKYVGPARAKLGKRSIFNIIGPLCNPANVQYQMVGVSDESIGEKLINVLKNLGRKRAIVVYGEPGIDEFSVAGVSNYWLLEEDGTISKHVFDPAIAGLHHHDYENVPGGDADENKILFEKILNHESCDGLLDMAALNAGAAIYISGKALSIVDGFNTAHVLIDSGKTKEFFEEYKTLSNQYKT
ncbi:MAG: anthranilate phosphoribosyltransferase [Planctomycetota bacterium]|nr:MAG: anthranilate phosphoribosyltransferase [Planctomycetota bacterium]